MIRRSRHGDYHIVEWSGPDEAGIAELFRRHPELIVGRYLVNTSFDSGHLTLTDSDLKGGWHTVGNLAHSPAIRSPDQIPSDQFDEWLIFESPRRVETFETLVNYLPFSPVDFDWKEKLDAYWTRISEIRPLHVMGQNGRTYLISRDQVLFEQIVGECDAGVSDLSDAAAQRPEA